MAITKATASSIAPAAKGDLVVGSATNDASVLAVGTNTHVLTADSSTTTGLKWAAPSSGAMTKINTTTVTASAAFNIDSIFTSTYKRYIISFQNFLGVYPAGGVKMQLRKSGTTYTSNYNWGIVRQTSNPAGLWTFSSNGSDSSFSLFSPDNRATQAELFIGNVNDSGNTEMNFYGNASAGGNAGAVNLMNGIYLGTPSNMDGLRFTITSGSMTGTIVVYGLEK